MTLAIIVGLRKILLLLVCKHLNIYNILIFITTVSHSIDQDCLVLTVVFWAGLIYNVDQDKLA